MKHFDGSERAPMPPMRDLVVGGFVEFWAMLLCAFSPRCAALPCARRTRLKARVPILARAVVFFGCGSASSNAHFNPPEGRGAPEWDSASVTIIALQFGLGSEPIWKVEPATRAHTRAAS